MNSQFLFANPGAAARAELEFLVGHLTRHGTPKARAALALREYRRFAELVAIHGPVFPMTSRAIDDVWHAHMLHSERYASFCRETYGEFLHHRPEGEGVELLASNETESFILAYRERFGEVPPPIWFEAEHDLLTTCGKAWELMTRAARTLLRGRIRVAPLCVPTGDPPKLCVPTRSTVAPV